MKISVEPGSYVVAVSGGVDSVVLLHALLTLLGVQLMVAHFDHGIRPDSSEDRRFVERLARQHGLLFEYGEGRLGAGASEATARDARYEFLHSVRSKVGAKAIITAHHREDVLEAAIINILRGTGRRGLASLRTAENVIRPLLLVSKQELYDYALERGLAWRDDPTNTDTHYLRNYVWHRLVPQLPENAKTALRAHIGRAEVLNVEIDHFIAMYLDVNTVDDQLDRPSFIRLPHTIAREIMASWLIRHNIRTFNRKTLERLVVAAKIKPAGKRVNVIENVWMIVERDKLALARRER